MGAQNSSFRKCIVEEYQRLKKDGRDHLTVDELTQLKLPRSQWTVNLKSFSVMFVLDRNKDGRFSVEELQAFYELACERAKLYQTYEYMSMMNGYCTLMMWRSVSGAGGYQEFSDWVCNLLRECNSTEQFRQYPGVQYINRDSIETIYHVLGVKESQGLDFQSFFDLLQRAAEEKDLMDLGNEELDDYLPLEVVGEFARSMIQGMQKVMADIYPANEVQRLDL
mmetsp:Transcript_6435/g.16881  ORF Transcript_6435/g.16881 Transcript_6435/m.16881 type:complete len:223 (+) Transcript_6435:111-779(+)|eukprot:jgi/Tetstr1/458811/TSEL_045195.t1